MEDLKPKPTNQKKKPLNTLISALNANIKQILQMTGRDCQTRLKKAIAIACLKKHSSYKNSHFKDTDKLKKQSKI